MRKNKKSTEPDDDFIKEIMKLIRELPIDNVRNLDLNPKTVENEFKKGRCLLNGDRAKTVRALFEFFEQLRVKECEHDIEIIQRPYSGNICVKFHILDMWDDHIQDFCSLLRHASSLCIGKSTDGRIIMDITIPGLFISSASISASGSQNKDH